MARREEEEGERRGKSADLFMAMSRGPKWALG